MANNNNAIAAGLDIGTTKIAVMVGRRQEDGSVEIIGVGQSPSTGVSKGAIQNITKTIAGIRELGNIRPIGCQRQDAGDGTGFLHSFQIPRQHPVGVLLLVPQGRHTNDGFVHRNHLKLKKEEG